MAKTPTEIRSYARGHTETAVNVLVGIMNETSAPHSARVAAANSVLDRGWGKPSQPLASDEESPLQIIHKIERVIVSSKNTNG